MDKEIQELKKAVEEKQKQELAVANTNADEMQVSESSVATQVAHDAIQSSYEKHTQELKNSNVFNELTKEIVEESAKAELKRDALDILDQKQKNELAEYTLECEKQKLEYRKKMEKGLIKEEVKSDITKKKIETLKNRYGYLYEKDAKGEPKGFVANKFVNKYKEFCNWYKGTGDGFRKIVGTTLKVLIWGGIAFLIITFGFKGLNWLSKIKLG